VPVVLTLHNYRYICANGLFLRDGGPREDCLGASPYQAVTHRCYRDSKLGSLSLARLIAHHQKRGTWRSKVNRFVALTEFARSKFVAAGFPQEKVAVKPNFVASTEADEAAVGAPRAGALFVGRLAAEKGIATMMQAWRSLDVPLRVLGDGPLAGLVKGFGNPAVEPLGWRSSDEVADEMRRAGFLVMPSEWYEGFPLTLVEAFSRGLPVLASGIGGMAEVVEDGVTGLHFAPGDVGDIVEKVAWAAGHPDEMRRMGENARRAYERLYSAEANYDMLQAIYDAAVEDRKLQTGG